MLSETTDCAGGGDSPVLGSTHGSTIIGDFDKVANHGTVYGVSVTIIFGDILTVLSKEAENTALGVGVCA